MEQDSVTHRSLDGWRLQARYTFKSKLKLKMSRDWVECRIYRLEYGTWEGRRPPSGVSSIKQV